MSRRVQVCNFVMNATLDGRSSGFLATCVHHSRILYETPIASRTGTTIRAQSQRLHSFQSSFYTKDDALRLTFTNAPREPLFPASFPRRASAANRAYELMHSRVYIFPPQVSRFPVFLPPSLRLHRTDIHAKWSRSPPSAPILLTPDCTSMMEAASGCGPSLPVLRRAL